jgi:hypothetical protein
VYYRALTWHSRRRTEESDENISDTVAGETAEVRNAWLSKTVSERHRSTILVGENDLSCCH